MKNLDNEIKKRRLLADYYLKNIKNENILLPTLRKENNHVWHLFVIRTDKRDQLQKLLSKNGVQTLIHYPIPPHQQKAYEELNELKFEISEEIHQKALSLPISGIQSLKDTKKILDLVNNFH